MFFHYFSNHFYKSSFFIKIFMSENQPKLEDIGNSINPDAQTAKWMLEKVF